MKIEFTKTFIKTYKQRFGHDQTVQRKFQQRLRLFERDPVASILKDHALTGKMKGFRSFSVTGDIRVVYYVHQSTAYFVDIGTHNQVY